MLISQNICLVTCGDKLVVRRLMDKMFQMTVLYRLGIRDDNCYLIAVPGGSLAFAENPEESFLPHFRIFYEHKDVRSLILMDHTPCGRYADNDPAEHKKNMQAVADSVHQAYPDVEVGIHLLDHNYGQFVF